MDNLLEYPHVGQSSALSEIKYAAEGLALAGAHLVGKGAQRFWKNFWESPVQQRIARHLLILGLAASPYLVHLTQPSSVTAVDPNAKPAVTMETPPTTSTGVRVIPSHNESAPLPQEVPPQPQTLTQEVREQILKFQTEEPLAIARTASLRHVIQLVVADSRFGIPKTEQESWVNRMLGITFIESKGISDAFSGEAYGLAQLTKETANEIAGKYKIPNYDLNNVWDNLFMGTAYQLWLIRECGLKPEFAIPAYNLGPGSVQTALQAYPSNKIPSSAEELFNNPRVLEKLKANKVTDKAIKEARLYVPRFKAAVEIFSAKK